MNNTIEAVTLVTYILFTYLVLALLIERIVEIFVAVFNYIEYRKKWDVYWNRAAERLSQRYNRLYGYAHDNTGKIRAMLDRLLWNTITEEPYKGGKKIISADMIRLNYLRLGTRIAAFLLAAIIVVTLRLDFVDVLSLMVAGDESLPGFLESSSVVRFILTTAALSIGSEPLHQVIRGVEKFADKKRKAPGGQVS